MRLPVPRPLDARATRGAANGRPLRQHLREEAALARSRTVVAAALAACLLQDLVMTGCLSRVAFVPGVGAAPRSAQRRNLTGDPYFTNGERLLLVMDSRCRSIDEIQLLIR